MTEFNFLIPVMADSNPQDWLRVWSDRYTADDEREYKELIERHHSFSAEDFELIGKWKDDAESPGKWKPDVALVAYKTWMQAAQEMPKCPKEGDVKGFLDRWSGKEYTDVYSNGPRKKHFGLARATTLLHFVTGGHYPILDSRVKAAVARLLGQTISIETAEQYLETYCPLFSELAELCKVVDDRRRLDRALFSYGAYDKTAFPKIVRSRSE